MYQSDSTVRIHLDLGAKSACIFNEKKKNPATPTDHPEGNDRQAAYHWSSEGDVTS